MYVYIYIYIHVKFIGSVYQNSTHTGAKFFAKCPNPFDGRQSVVRNLKTHCTGKQMHGNPQQTGIYIIIVGEDVINHPFLKLCDCTRLYQHKRAALLTFK